MVRVKDVVGLIVLFLVICVACAVGFVAYSIANDVAAKTKEKMEKKNISLSKDGVKVGVKQVSSEQVSDSTQSTLMKVWNSAEWKGYKSKLGWGQTSATRGQGGAEYRQHVKRTASGRPA